MEEKCISNSRRCYKQWFGFMVLIMSSCVSYVDAVWPMPQMISSSMARYTLNPREFLFQYSSGSSVQSGCSVLDSAFKRYFPLIFTDYSAGNNNTFENKWIRVLKLCESVLIIHWSRSVVRSVFQNHVANHCRAKQ